MDVTDRFSKVHNTGFFSIIGTGFTQEEVDRQYDIGSAYFNLPLEESGDPKYRCDFTKGNYFGYRAVRIFLHASGQAKHLSVPIIWH
jgi:isopenicillin N synthase-like dioxygenase